MVVPRPRRAPRSLGCAAKCFPRRRSLPQTAPPGMSCARFRARLLRAGTRPRAAGVGPRPIAGGRTRSVPSGAAPTRARARPAALERDREECRDGVRRSRVLLGLAAAERARPGAPDRASARPPARGTLQPQRGLLALERARPSVRARQRRPRQAPAWLEPGAMRAGQGPLRIGGLGESVCTRRRSSAVSGG